MPFDSRETEAIGTRWQQPAPARAAWGWALLVLLLGLGLTAWLVRFEWHRSQDEMRWVAGKQVEQVAGGVARQLEECEHLIRAFQSVYLASDDVSASEYARAYENMQGNSVVRDSLQALAYARRQPADGEHYITTLYAPLEGNEAIAGLDVASQPANMEALQRARDSNQVAMSAAFPLRQLQAQGRAAAGFILRLPVYAGGLAPESLAGRRQASIGSIGASFRAQDLIALALQIPPSALADVMVFDSSDGSGRMLLSRQYGPRAAGPAIRRQIRFGGRSWELQAHVRAAPQAAGVWRDVLWLGVVISTLLAALTWSLASTRARAMVLAAAMSRRFHGSEERFRKLNELLPCLVLLARKDNGTIVYRNAAARSRLATRTGFAGLSMMLDGQAIAEWATLENTTAVAREVQMQDADGTSFWASTMAASVEIDGVPMWLLVANDISEQRQLTERLSYQASHDALTRLFNRQEFEARVQARLKVAGTDGGALLFIDLDQFKLINDTSGHAAGDALLVQLALTMGEELRPGDVLGRLGGDEFGVLLANAATAVDARYVAERLRLAIERLAFPWEQRIYMISASIGVVMLEAATSIRELFAQADAACYLAKEAGRNRLHVHSEADAAVARRQGEMEWANRVRDALRDGRLLLDYQELRSLQAPGTGTHVELLLRLRDEAGGVVLPGAFLPAAERYGLMPLIDRWVVDTALTHLDLLHPDGKALATCAINLSGASLEDDGLFERIEQLVEQHAIAPGRLLFEITETVAMRDFAASSVLLARLRALGCRVALDDFGAGMSSFGYLKNLPLDVLKIDGSFVQGLADDGMSQAIVKAVAEIGHLQGLQVVAEWVSSADIMTLLAGMNVDFAQGFALHRPERVLFQRDAHD
ncbi:EAL domain-containing protein [Thermomonas sp.]|uniref:bifunctional diguanylate cyclase/phosphodiesterase n=1 Tax=Thermomonas sp. TaxID=1971895 RepID=UPI0035B4EFE1